MKKILNYFLCLCLALSFMPTNVFAARYYNTGSCGALLNNGVLTISGEGATGDHNNYSPQPWLTQIDTIHTVIINDDVTGIGNNTFKYMRALKNVTIGKNVSYFGTNAFLGCENLENVNWNATNAEDLSERNTIFSECGTSANGITVTFGENVEYIPANLFWSSSTPKIKKVVFSGPVEIGYNAFALCGKLDVHISSVDDWCKSKFKSTDSNPLIGGSSLYLNGMLLKEIETTRKLKGISEFAFLGCDSLEKVTIKNGLTQIGEFAFSECVNLKEIYLPKSLKSIGWEAFSVGKAYNKKHLDIYYAGSEEEWNAIRKDDYFDSYSTSVTVHYNEIYEEVPLIGDTNADKNIDIRDVILLAQYCAEHPNAIEEVNPSSADTNGDGNVNVSDVVLLAKFCTGWDVTLG